MNWFPTPKIVLLLAVGISIEWILAFSIGILVHKHYNTRWGTDWPDGIANAFDHVTSLVAGWIPPVLSVADALACMLLLIAGGHRPKEWAALALSVIILLYTTFLSFAFAVGMTA